MKNVTKLKGHWRIEIREAGKLARVIELDNKLTEAYRQNILGKLKGDTTVSLEIKYLAVGTGSTPATISDTALETEIFRSVPTYQTIQGNTLQTTWVLLVSQANAHLREIGVFIGDATATADSGTLMSRINIDIEKTSAQEVTFIRSDIVEI